MAADTQEKIDMALAAAEARMIETFRKMLEQANEEMLDRLEAMFSAQASAAGAHASTLKQELAAARRKKRI